ncbi:unnamed protein product [Eruca vesicaria subsp. sativa]|uniref:Histone deacetylase interacting domain-containing protein n=1 Tax=Eruca vesicaria subsp. sativa TaxID=29727 RepID=A0ABC8L590_ERUVS|nr:unnamed protein product [Eruca vesicaria subsp. sativa]
MVNKNALELWSIFRERLSPTDMKTLTSLLIDYNRRRIEKTQLIASALLLFKNDEFLHRCFTDYLYGKKSQEDEDGETQSDEEGEIREQDPKTELCVRNKEEAMVYYKEQEDEKSHQNVEEDLEDAKIRVSDERDLEHATNVFSLEGKRRRILKPEPPKKTLARVTPSYETIPEEDQFPVSNKVLNNKYSVTQRNSGSGHKKLSKYEEAIERCQDDMFESDMMMGSLESAVENAEKVIAEEMSVEDLGVKFYKCIERLYCRDMSEIVRENHMRALPVILIRLKQKLDELTAVRENWKIIWKQAIEENTAKQREATAQQGRRKK